MKFLRRKKEMHLLSSSSDDKTAHITQADTIHADNNHINIKSTASSSSQESGRNNEARKLQT